MVNQQLLDYIKHQMQQAGVSRDEIKKTLITAGWQVLDIDEAFKSLTPSAPIISQPLVVTKQPIKLATNSSQPVGHSSAVSANQVKSTGAVRQFKVNKKILFIVIAVVIGLSLVGGGVFAYFSYFQSPERIIQKMLERVADIKSLEYAGDINMEFNADVGELLTNQAALLGAKADGSVVATSTSINKKVGRAAFNFSGSYDWQNPAEFKGWLLLNLKTEIPMFGEPSVGLEVRNINKDFYIKLNKAPIIMVFDLSSLENQWIKIDSQSAAETKNDLDEKLSPAQIAQIKEAFVADKVVKITATLPSEKIDGVDTHHYKYAIDKEGLRKYILDVDKIIATSPELTGEKLADFNKEMDNLVAPEGEIWIGKKDYLPYKFTSNIVINETEESKASGNISIILSAKNYNKPVQVEVPSPVKTTEEIMSVFMGNLADSYSLPTNNDMSADENGLLADKKSVLTDEYHLLLEDQVAFQRDSKRVSDVTQIQVALEMFYNDTGDYPVSASSTLFTSGGQIASSQGVYMRAIPFPPKSADGPCSSYNSYNYTYIPGEKTGTPGYRIEYCLEQEDGIFPSGQHFAGPAGINVESSPNITKPDVSDLDSDNDGLSDLEETSQYKTDPNNPDTDGDGFKDGAEVKNGYNPNGAGKLQ